MSSRLNIFALTVLSSLSFAVNAQLPDYCYQDDIISISLPYENSDSSHSDHFIYRFKYINITSSTETTTIINLPGGPGEHSIEDGSKDWFPKFNAIFIDPRGVGCNSDLKQDLPEGFFTTENLSSDVLAVIQALRLKNYIILGTSYGTIWSTVVASRASSGEATPPKAVALIGTAGKAILDPYKGLIENWEEVKHKLSPNIKVMLQQDALPFNLSGKYWGIFIVAELSKGHSSLLERLQALASTSDERKQKLKNEIEALGKAVYPDIPYPISFENILYQDIWCSEIGETDNTDLELIKGKLVGPIYPHFCDGHSLFNPFDSKDWQMNVPIYYFQGGQDPLTYPELAQYHFEHQSSERYFVFNPKGGHLPMYDVSDCWNTILDLIDTHDENFAQTLKKCAPQLEIFHRY